MSGPVAQVFGVDTGCDYDLIIAKPLRDHLVAAGVGRTLASIQWGHEVPAERFRLKVKSGGSWRAAEAFFPFRPFVDENLLGLPLLPMDALCIRTSQHQSWVGRA